MTPIQHPTNTYWQHLPPTHRKLIGSACGAVSIAWTYFVFENSFTDFKDMDQCQATQTQYLKDITSLATTIIGGGIGYALGKR